MKFSSVKELCEYIFDLENEYGLLNFEIKGINPWICNRVEIYYKLASELNIFTNYSRDFISNKNSIFTYFNILKNSIIYSKIFYSRKVDYLIFSSSRSKLVNGELIDIYTKYLIDEIKRKNKSFIECESFYNGKHERKYNKNKLYLDYISLLKNIGSKFYNLKLSEKEKTILNNLEKEIIRLGINFNIKQYLISQTKKLLISYYLYNKLLKKFKPTTIYVVVSYGRYELIKAAKKLGIRVIELQHGTFSKYHLGYSYPNLKKKLDYFPDEFWVWNEYWKDLVNFPIDRNNIKIYPFQYLEIKKQKYKNIKKKKNQMVVLCQGGLTDKIAKKILDNLEKFKQFSIIFKLHPEEYGKSHLYKNLSILKERLNISVVENVDLYKLLAESEYQAGVFSTALYEGIEFNCKTILFNLPGIEYMDKFIQKYGGEII